MKRRMVLVLALIVALAAPVAASTWSQKCDASHGVCVGCCTLALIEAAFNALGGWN